MGRDRRSRQEGQVAELDADGEHDQARTRQVRKIRQWRARGPSNPLGSRALYLYRSGRDTYYRIHGTTEPWTIGKAVSNGCIRLINEHVEDLYERVQVGTTVVVRHGNEIVSGNDADDRI